MSPTALLRSLVVAYTLIQACEGSSARGNTAEAQVALVKGTPAQNLTNAYLLVQTKLALDDFAGARAALGSVRSAAQASELAVSADLRKRIDSAAVVGVAGRDIVALRAAFVPLSDAMLSWLKSQANPLSEGLLVAHCPMARDGQGARWLQRGKQLRNPYFGAQMLTCGSIEATLEPAKKL